MKTHSLYLTFLLSLFLFKGYAQDDCLVEETLFINGKIITMNANNDIVDAIRIREGKIIAIGENAKESPTCTKIIDLKGKTVIPGLIDSHVHFVRQGNMPGATILEAENATSIPELITIIEAASQQHSEDKVLTIMGGISELQFEERRLPTKEELDKAFPKRSVYIQKGFSGPAIVNQSAANFFNSNGLAINEDGILAMGSECNKAFAILKDHHSESDKVEGLQQLMTYANSVGLTTVQDEGGVSFPGAGYFDHRNDYDALTTLWKANKLSIRFRIQHVVYDKTNQPGDLEDKIDHTWQGFGDAMLKYTTVGEHIVSFPIDGNVNSAYESKALKAAKDGWPHEQHSVSYVENVQHLRAIKQIHASYPISDLRWSLAHVFEIGGLDTTKVLIEDLIDMKMGLKVQNHGYVTLTDRFPLGKTFKSDNAGPLYRTLLATGVPLGAGTDGCLVVPLNPWYSIYYMITGKNATGKLVNPNETISRLEALRMYTLGSAWFSFDEENLGSLEAGKTADFVILNKDYLSISEEEIKTIRASATYVNGIKVYQD
jgi:predicted amidohydrolase YtcJ